MKLSRINESQLKDTGTFSDRTQAGSQYGATAVNDILHKKKKKQAKIAQVSESIYDNEDSWEEPDQISEFSHQYPTPQEQVKLLLLMAGINDYQKVEDCDSGVCHDLIVSIILSNEFQKFLKYMRS